MSCSILDKWKCSLCFLKDCEDRLVIKCIELDGIEIDCGMPILVQFGGSKNGKLSSDHQDPDECN